MKKKIKDLTIGEISNICSATRNTNGGVEKCVNCPLGGYNCASIFGMKTPNYFPEKINMDGQHVIELEIDIQEIES